VFSVLAITRPTQTHGTVSPWRHQRLPELVRVLTALALLPRRGPDMLCVRCSPGPHAPSTHLLPRALALVLSLARADQHGIVKLDEAGERGYHARRLSSQAIRKAPLRSRNSLSQQQLRSVATISRRSAAGREARKTSPHAKIAQVGQGRQVVIQAARHLWLHSSRLNGLGI
jgi:hypothetical protein